MCCEDLRIRDCEEFDIKLAGTGEIFMDVFVQYSSTQSPHTSASLSQYGVSSGRVTCSDFQSKVAVPAQFWGSCYYSCTAGLELLVVRWFKHSPLLCYPSPLGRQSCTPAPHPGTKYYISLYFLALSCQHGL